jgi:dolichyl-phosphate beta-glucosyltransferase
MMQKIAIIIPCYNEELRFNYKVFDTFFNDPQLNVHLIFINDGSSDSTHERLITYQKRQIEKIEIVHLEKNAGKGNAVRMGFMQAFQNEEYDILGFMDADMATPVSEGLKIVKHLRDHNEYTAVFGSRVNRLGVNIERGKVRRLFSRVLAWMASVFTGFDVYDTQCGAKFFRRNIAQKLFQDEFNTRWLFDMELIFRLSRLTNGEANNKIYEFPLLEWYDIGDSKIRLKDFYRIGTEFFKILLIYK